MTVELSAIDGFDTKPLAGGGVTLIEQKPLPQLPPAEIDIVFIDDSETADRFRAGWNVVNTRNANGLIYSHLNGTRDFDAFVRGLRASVAGLGPNSAAGTIDGMIMRAGRVKRLEQMRFEMMNDLDANASVTQRGAWSAFERLRGTLDDLRDAEEDETASAETIERICDIRERIVASMDSLYEIIVAE